MNEMEFIEKTSGDTDKAYADNLLKKYVRIPPVSKVLLICFALPALLITLVYFCLLVWPLGDNSVLVLDLNAQYVYYFEKLRNILVSGDSILYSFERALGGEFMGIFAYYLSSPLSILVALLPKAWMTESIFLLLVLKTGLCGLTFGYYLMKTRRARPVWMVLFACMYAMCSYVVVMQHNIMWMDNVILFPLILYGMDELIREGRFRLYVATLALAIFSNFYIGYMTCLFLAVYFFIRYATMTPEEKGGSGHKRFLVSLVRILLFSLLAVMITAVILLPAYYSLSFGKLDFTEPKYTAEQLFDFTELLTKAFFGSYDSVRPEGMPFVYGGTLMLLLLPLYFAAPAIRLRHKVGVLLTLSYLTLSFNFSILDIIWHGFQRPNWLNARFAFMFTCIALIAAYDGFVHLKETGIRKILPCCIGSIGLLILLQALNYEHVRDFVTVWTGIFFICGLGVLVPYAFRERETGDVSLFTYSELFLVAFVVLELICNGVIMVYSLDDDVSYTSRNGYRNYIDKYDEAVELMEGIDEEKNGEYSFYRAEKTGHRKKNDNFAIDINGLSNSTSTLNAKAVTFLHNMGLSARSHWSMYYGGNPLGDALFGLRYLLVDHSTDNVPEYIDTFYTLLDTTEDGIDIYENNYSLGVIFGVSDNILTYAEYDEDKDRELEKLGLPYIRDIYPDAMEYKTPFQYMNRVFSAMLGYEVEVYTPVSADESNKQGVSHTYAIGHIGYELDDTGYTPKVEFTLDVTQDLPIYFHFPTTYPREVSLKLNSDNKGSYFEDDSFCVQQLGILEQGKNTFSLYLEESTLYLASGCEYFWYFHEDVFKEVIEALSGSVMDARSQRDSLITGTITVQEGMNTIFTTIPYDECWKVYVDGVQVEIYCLLDTLLGFTVPSGEHTVELRYEPVCVKYGIIITLAGTILYAGLSLWDIHRRSGITVKEIVQTCRGYCRSLSIKQRKK